MEHAISTGSSPHRAARPRPLNLDELTSAVRVWAAQHKDGTAEDAMRDLGMANAPNAKDTLIVTRGILARFRWDQEGLHKRTPAAGLGPARNPS
jgi:hypothetical protein